MSFTMLSPVRQIGTARHLHQGHFVARTVMRPVALEVCQQFEANRRWRCNCLRGAEANCRSLKWLLVVALRR